jgi:rare lipoprotein A (peptidoglycan hydrolase)
VKRHWLGPLTIWAAIGLLVLSDVTAYAGGWSTATASYYADKFYGNRTACGQTYSPSLHGVAHRTLPCGTKVTFRHSGNVITVPVNDRGPWVDGRMWDLSWATCRALAHCFTGPIEYRLGGDGPAPVAAPRVPSRGAVLPQTDSE